MRPAIVRIIALLRARLMEIGSRSVSDQLFLHRFRTIGTAYAARAQHPERPLPWPQPADQTGNSTSNCVRSPRRKELDGSSVLTEHKENE